MTTKQHPIVEVVEEPQAEPTCRHHWVIATPQGPTSKGVCRLCGEERLFHNYLGSHPWEQDEGSALGTGGPGLNMN